MDKQPAVLTYLSDISYLRVSPRVFHRFKVLVEQQDFEAIEALIHTTTYRKLRYDQLAKPIITELEAYYNDKSYGFSLNFLFLERLLNQQKKYFPTQSFFPTQSLLFPNLSPTNSNVRPSVVLTGEVDLFRFDNNYSAYGYLTRENILRICSFFKESQLDSKYHFLNAICQFTAQDYQVTRVHDQSFFIKKYAFMEGEAQTKEAVAAEIWTLDDDEWQTFQKLKHGFDAFFDSLKHLIHFFKECLKYEETQVIIRYFFH